jgi:hypothetical protein
MKKITTILLLSGLFFACKRQAGDDRATTAEKLKKTMTNFLYTSTKSDSTQVKYHVLDVTFYEGADEYDCEFKVELKEGHIDTTGTMVAKISKDLSKVTRRY